VYQGNHQINKKTTSNQATTIQTQLGFLPVKGPEATVTQERGKGTVPAQHNPNETITTPRMRNPTSK
jgi:hypothetical protein